ncbi:predicted protein [Sclerotinia sclerotiorum 1980 UF-70]|uniref:Uncharacterized protein n=1 Tax=Sclerotinia sclerotiorum (strain ATCC 18683 / 1980 / Ss-1) TaxID=665079 RepID=A7E5G1_SCLS1|nr:predicted protein [Sclerotinia sclerotiorum 1980 UF-70]EDN91133.1 predicted protein [Sclerotinia sclerotiorum 1980 UF-70]
MCVNQCSTIHWITEGWRKEEIDLSDDITQSMTHPMRDMNNRNDKTGKARQ